MNRNKEIIRTSIIGITANIFLASFKALVGIVAGSVAITLDAVNNLSDALSGVITIIGTKLSARPADAQHPFGHGRIEYFAAIIISIIVLIAGITSLIESAKKLFHPTIPSYTTITLAVIVVAIAVKIALGYYVKRKGRALQSDALVASGADASFDAVVTLSTLLSAVIMLVFGINLDGIFGTLISLIIIKAGVDMLGSPINQLLGKGAPADFVETIRREVMQNKGVYGVYDIILNYYGPDTIIGSLHINVPDTMTACEIHRLTRQITEQLARRHGIICTVGIYAVNTQGPLAELQRNVVQFANSQADVMQVHGFYYYDDRNEISIDVIPTTDVHDDEAFTQSITQRFQAQFPVYKFAVVVDHNYTGEAER